MDACGFFVERRFGIELNINPVEMALVEFPPLDGTRPTGDLQVRSLMTADTRSSGLKNLQSHPGLGNEPAAAARSSRRTPIGTQIGTWQNTRHKPTILLVEAGGIEPPSEGSHRGIPECPGVAKRAEFRRCRARSAPRVTHGFQKIRNVSGTCGAVTASRQPSLRTGF